MLKWIKKWCWDVWFDDKPVEDDSMYLTHEERIEILKGFKYIDYVYTFNDEDETACDLIKKVA